MNSKMIIAATVIIITIIVAGIETYYLTLPSATPTTKVPKRLKIISDTSYTERIQNITFFVVAGVVQNNLTTNVDSANITATFHDAGNKTIGTGSTHVELKIIKPEQNAPFEVYFLSGSPTDVPDIKYVLTAVGFETNEEPIAGLQILNDTLGESVDADGYHIISGEVQNKGLRKAVGVKIICTYYNLDGNLIAISHTYVSSEIDAGHKATFEISSKPHKISSASYDLLIVAHHYEPLFIMHYILLALLIAAFLIFIAYMKRRGW